jgi:hypothetical protein
MEFTEELLNQFKEASMPLVKFLNENFHPYVHVVVENNGATIHEGQAHITIHDFIIDENESA